jgi:non-heme chloroperoxidase
MHEHTITGGGGIKLHVMEAGNPDGRPLLFIHGWSQCRLAWLSQFSSDLTHDLRLVALDNRGHGLSEKPHDAYADPKLWADDVQAVITELGLERPIVSGWSYGGIVICDYLRIHGESALGGIHLVAALTRLGTEAAFAVIGEEFVNNAVASFSTDVEQCTRAIEAYMAQVTYRDLPPDAWYFILGYNAIVPPRVRQALLSRNVENDDLLPAIGLPTLITQGDQDEIVLPLAAQQLAATIPQAMLSVYEDIGHAPFAEDPVRFNRELREFASTAAGGVQRTAVSASPGRRRNGARGDAEEGSANEG